MEDPSRRRFLRRTALGSSLVCNLFGGWHELLNTQTAPAPSYDLLIRGGRVLDPSQKLSQETDVAISAGKIVRVAQGIPESQAAQVLDARGKFVTPGLVDIHVHVYDGVVPIGIPADPNCVAKGVTSVVDAGSSGAHTFPGFRKYVVNTADTKVYALLNISVVGQSSLSNDNPWGELLDIRYANPQLAIRTIEKNRDVILGIKIRMTRNLAGDHDLAALRLAREAADAVQMPIMVHIGGTYSSLKDILALLKPGDVVTHTYRSGEGGILDSHDRVLPEVRQAVENGVHLDVGHGVGSFAFQVAEAAFRQELLPGTISSDIHQYNVDGPVFDLATTLSKFLYLGMSLDQVIERATVNSANTFKFPRSVGSLREGSDADVAVFDLSEGNFEFVDADKQKRIGHLKLIPVATLVGGRIYGSAAIPVATLHHHGAHTHLHS